MGQSCWGGFQRQQGVIMGSCGGSCPILPPRPHIHTFIRHMLASILSCSTILRACPMLMVLLTGVSPFMGVLGGERGLSPIKLGGTCGCWQHPYTPHPLFPQP